MRPKTRRPWTRAVLVAVVIAVGAAEPVFAQLGPPEAFARIRPEDLTESLVSLNNFTASPGIEGSNLNVDFGDGQPHIRYGRFSIQIPISIQTKLSWLNVYTDIGYGSLWMDDRFFALNGQGDVVHIRPERQLDSGRLGLGVEFRPTKGWYITPYLAAAFTGIESKSSVASGTVDVSQITPVQYVLIGNWNAKSWSVGGVLDLKYLRWYQNERSRLDLQLRYALTWTETFNESLSILDSSALRNTLVGEALWRSITDVRVFDKRLAWNVFVNSTSFPGQDLNDLGFTYYFGLGAGIDLYVPEKLWGRIGRNFIGIRGSGIVGNNTSGWSVVISLRN